jgi:hypothetical protein
MSKEANIKNQQKLKVYLSKKNDIKSNSTKNNKLRKSTSTN